jgi:hypothetical protein
MKVLPGCKRGSGFDVVFVVDVVAVVVAVAAVEGRGTTALEMEADLAVLEVALEALETGLFSGETNSGFLG